VKLWGPGIKADLFTAYHFTLVAHRSFPMTPVIDAWADIIMVYFKTA
jgi:hypothetical protein